MSFMIETSARHIHLTQETVEKLFGKGYELTVRKPLSYPGQYACNERLTIVGPKKEMANVSILGPVRKADQVEVSATDARTLGIDAPVRESGHVEGSGACKLVGPKGEVELQREDQGFTVPRGLRVLREVSGDWRLKNAALAGHVPPEEELLAEMEENGGFSLHEGAECGKISWICRKGTKPPAGSV